MSKQILIDKGGAVGMHLTEGKDGKWTVRGEFGRADVPTENKRVYPRAIWEKEIERMQSKIREKKVFMEIEHPQSGKTSLSRVAAILSDLQIAEDGQILGEAIVVDNDNGRLIKSLIDAGAKVGVSSRGMGSTKSIGKGLEEVQGDFEYITHDFVADPAVTTSYPEYVGESGGKVATVTEAVPVVEVIKELKNEVIEVTESEQTRKVEMSEVKEVAATEVPVVTTEVKESSETVVEAPVVVPAVEASVVEAPAAEVKAESVEIEQLKKELSEAKVQISQMEKDAQELVSAVRKLSVGLVYETERARFPMSDKFAELVGEAKSFSDVNSLNEAIVRGTRAANIIKAEEEKSARNLKIQESRMARREQHLKSLLEEKENALKENLVKRKEELARVYVAEKTAGNPNAPKIRQLLEGVTEKKKIDQVISDYSVAAPNSSEYNSIRNRLDSLKESKVVETQLQEAHGKYSSAESSDVENPLLEGVDSQIAELGLVSLREVKGLAGIN